jgi:epoxide hydrolase-like predicted phosphatase
MIQRKYLRGLLNLLNDNNCKMKKKKGVNSKIKAVIFDIGGVLQLTDYIKVRGKLSRKVCEHSTGTHEYISRKLGLDLDTWFDSIDTAYAKSIEGEISDKKAVMIIAKNLRIGYSKLHKLFIDAYNRQFKKNKKLYDFSHHLKKEGYIVGILSDQWALSAEALISKKDRKGFDPVIVSNEVGFRKPDVHIYRLLMKELRKIEKGIKYSEVLFIDNRDWNTKPAEKLGMKAILFKDNKQCLKELKGFGVL